jgi:transcriptional regulator
MYIPKHFEETDAARLGRFIAEHGFGLLMSCGDGRPFCSHVPFLYEPGRLLCHLARANPQAGQLEADGTVLAVFHGPHAYISPTWYESPGVPTWNYVAVHVYGRASAIREEDQLRALVERMTTHYEANEPKPWKPDFKTSMLSGIVGFEIAVTEIEGKFKLSQNRPQADRANVIGKLCAKRNDLSVDTARFMQDLE